MNCIRAGHDTMGKQTICHQLIHQPPGSHEMTALQSPAKGESPLAKHSGGVTSPPPCRPRIPEFTFSFNAVPAGKQEMPLSPLRPRYGAARTSNTTVIPEKFQNIRAMRTHPQFRDRKTIC